MADKSAIHWTDSTWNPTSGCTHVSPGCEHCYAEALSLRFHRSAGPWTKQNEALNVKLHPDRLDLPLHWKRPRRVFVDSMSDLFHDLIPADYIAQEFAVMALASNHTFQVLTKRPARMQALITDASFEATVDAKIREHGYICACELDEWPLPNVWLGVSVEDQRRADERIPLLVQTPAAVRFLSCEPLLGSIDLDQWLDVGLQVWLVDKQDTCHGSEAGWHLWTHPITGLKDWRPGIDWVIVGGESGAKRRLFEIDWARSIRDQCQAADVAFFYKQGGGIRPGMNRELDGRTWDEYPDEVKYPTFAGEARS